MLGHRGGGAALLLCSAAAALVPPPRAAMGILEKIVFNPLVRWVIRSEMKFMDTQLRRYGPTPPHAPSRPLAPPPPPTPPRRIALLSLCLLSLPFSHVHPACHSIFFLVCVHIYCRIA